MNRVLVLLGGIIAGAVAAVAVWARKKDELDNEAYETAPERGLTPLPAEPEEPATADDDDPVAPAVPAAAAPPDGSNGAAGSPRMATADGPGGPGDDGPTHGHVGGADDLRRIKGIGIVSHERLAEQGVTTFAQIAAWDDDAIDATAASIRVSAERIRREDWVGQARGFVGGTADDGDGG